jgi:hypothetical protein
MAIIYQTARHHIHVPRLDNFRSQRHVCLLLYYLMTLFGLNKVSQEDRSISREVTVSVILSEESVYVHVSYSERFPR